MPRKSCPGQDEPLTSQMHAQYVGQTWSLFSLFTCSRIQMYMNGIIRNIRYISPSTVVSTPPLAHQVFCYTIALCVSSSQLIWANNVMLTFEGQGKKGGERERSTIHLVLRRVLGINPCFWIMIFTLLSWAHLSYQQWSPQWLCVWLVSTCKVDTSPSWQVLSMIIPLYLSSLFSNISIPKRRIKQSMIIQRKYSLKPNNVHAVNHVPKRLVSLSNPLLTLSNEVVPNTLWSCTWQAHKYMMCGVYRPNIQN